MWPHPDPLANENMKNSPDNKVCPKKEIKNYLTLIILDSLLFCFRQDFCRGKLTGPFPCRENAFNVKPLMCNLSLHPRPTCHFGLVLFHHPEKRMVELKRIKYLFAQHHWFRLNTLCNPVRSVVQMVGSYHFYTSD